MSCSPCTSRHPNRFPYQIHVRISFSIRISWPGHYNLHNVCTYCKWSSLCDFLSSPFTLQNEFPPHLDFIYFFVAQQPSSGLGRLPVDVSRSHTITHTHIRARACATCWDTSKRTISSSERPVNYTTHNKHKRRRAKASARFKPAIPAVQRPQIYALDRRATGIGLLLNTWPTFNVYSPLPAADVIQKIK